MRRLFQPTGPVTTNAGHKIRIVSYNILADKYSSYNSYCPQQYLAWSYRCPRILAELESYAADLVCLQEVEQTVFDQQLQPWMQQRGYHSLFHPRRSPAGVPEPDEGVTLHFRTSAFTHVDSVGVLFAAADASSALPPACCSRHRQNRFLKALRQREEGCLLALLRHEPSQQQLLVVSTHLFWNPLHPDLKVAQAAIMCSSIAAFLQRHGSSVADVPVVIGGDFNSLWQKHRSDPWDEVPAGQVLQSGVYTLMQQGQLPPSHQDHPRNRGCSTCSSISRSQGWHMQQQQQLGMGQTVAAYAPELRGGSAGTPMSCSPASSAQVEDDSAVSGGRSSAWSGSSPLVEHMFTTAGLQLDSSYHMAHGREPPLTTRTATFSGCLDYIWLSRQHWQVASTLAMPYTEHMHAATPQDVMDLGPCPNQQVPSDHLAVGCNAVLLPMK